MKYLTTQELIERAILRVERTGRSEMVAGHFIRKKNNEIIIKQDDRKNTNRNN